MAILDGLEEEGGRGADLTFGELLAWHLLRGTRPHGSVDRKGQRWVKKDFAGAVSRDSRAVRYWLSNQHLPTDTRDVELALFGKDEAKYAEWRLALREAHARLIAQDGPELPSAPERPSGKAHLSNIPIRLPRHFLGRHGELEAIDRGLRHSGGRAAIAALHGLRGVGKTTLAAAYAEKYRDEYRTAWWIRAQSPETMRSDLASLGRRLGWVESDTPEDAAVDGTIERLGGDGKDILLIFDNAVSSSSLRCFLPRGGKSKILVTSTSHVWRDIAEPIEIGTWPKDVAAEYLVVRTGRENEREMAGALAQMLGGLPLAHEQAAAYCERLDVSMSDYIGRFEAAPGRLLDDERHAPLEYNDGLTVAKTYTLAIEEAIKLNPAAGTLMSYAASLPSEPIPILFFLEGLAWTGETAFSDEGLHDAIAALRAFSLVYRVSTTEEHDPSFAAGAIQLHRLVRQVALRLQRPEEADEIRSNLGVAMVKFYPDPVPNSYDDTVAWGRCWAMDPLVVSIIDNELDKPSRLGVGVVNLLRRLAVYRHRALGDTKSAKLLLERAVQAIEKYLGPQDPGLASTLNELSDVVSQQGDFADARRHLERALAIYEIARGPAHLDTVSNMHNLAVLLLDMEEFPAARELFDRSRGILEVAFKDDVRLASLISGYARLHIKEGELTEARRLLERALTIQENKLEPNHPQIALSLTRLAELMVLQGEFGTARQLLERTLSIYEEVYGPDHPETRGVVSKLAAAAEAASNPV